MVFLWFSPMFHQCLSLVKQTWGLRGQQKHGFWASWTGGFFFEWSVSAETWLLKDVERKVEPLWTTKRNIIETFNETFNETVIWKNGWKGKSWRWKQGITFTLTIINAHSHWNSSGKGMNVDNVAPEMLISNGFNQYSYCILIWFISHSSGLDIQAAFCACQGPRASVFSLLWRVWRYCSRSDISHIIRVRCCQFMLHAPWSQWLSNDCPCWPSVAIQRCHKKSRKTKDQLAFTLFLGVVPLVDEEKIWSFLNSEDLNRSRMTRSDQICPDVDFGFPGNEEPVPAPPQWAPWGISGDPTWDLELCSKRQVKNE